MTFVWAALALRALSAVLAVLFVSATPIPHGAELLTVRGDASHIASVTRSLDAAATLSERAGLQMRGSGRALTFDAPLLSRESLYAPLLVGSPGARARARARLPLPLRKRVVPGVAGAGLRAPPSSLFAKIGALFKPPLDDDFVFQYSEDVRHAALRWFAAHPDFLADPANLGAGDVWTQAAFKKMKAVYDGIEGGTIAVDGVTMRPHVALTS